MIVPKHLIAFVSASLMFSCSSEPATETTPAADAATEQSTPATLAAPAEDKGTTVNVNEGGVEVKSNVGDLSVSTDSVHLTLPKK